MSAPDDGRCPMCGEDEIDGARCLYCGFHSYDCGFRGCVSNKEPGMKMSELMAAHLAEHPAHGWAKGTLMIAFDIVEEVLAEQHAESDAHRYLTMARDAIENADVVIEKGQ